MENGKDRMTNDEVHDFLRAVMPARPTPAVPRNLADRAMRLGRAVSLARPVPPVSFWSTLTGVAASLLIVGVLAVGGWAFFSAGSSASTDAAAGTTDTVDGAADTTSVDTTASTSSTSSGSTQSTAIAAGVVLLAAAALWGTRSQVVVAGPLQAA